MTLPTKTSVFCVALLAVSFTSCGPFAHAATIDVGIIKLEPAAGQTVEFFVTGTNEISGMEFNIQVGDGGSDLSGHDTGPRIEAIDLVTGTIFGAGASPSPVDQVAFPLARQSTVDITNTVVADGIIATVTFDASGMIAGTEIPLRLSGVAGSFNTQFFDALGQPVPVDIQNGSILITPEPSTTVLLATLLAGILPACRRRRRMRS